MSSLTIVLPTRNRADRLSATLAELASQRITDLEVIVIDDASTDETPSVLAAAEDAEDFNIHAVRHNVPAGRVRSLIDGFASAESPTICWLDDRLIPSAGTLERLLEVARRGGPEGMLALFHDRGDLGPPAYTINEDSATSQISHVHGTLVADYGVIRGDTYRMLGGFDASFRESAAEADLSFRIWSQGLSVTPMMGGRLAWTGRYDLSNAPGIAVADEQRLLNKWHLPPRRSDEMFHAEQPCRLNRISPLAA